MSFWIVTDPCVLTYTAMFDVFVDSFFLVLFRCVEPMCILKSSELAATTK